MELSTSAPKRDPYAPLNPAATAPLLAEPPQAKRRSRECQSKVLDGCWYGLTTGPWAEWTFKDLQRQVVGVDLSSGYHRGSIPHAKFVAVCLSDDRCTRGGQEVCDSRVERLSKVWRSCECTIALERNMGNTRFTITIDITHTVTARIHSPNYRLTIIGGAIRNEGGWCWF